MIHSAINNAAMLFCLYFYVYVYICKKLTYNRKVFHSSNLSHSFSTQQESQQLRQKAYRLRHSQFSYMWGRRIGELGLQPGGDGREGGGGGG